MFSGDDPRLSNLVVWMLGGSLHAQSAVAGDNPCALCEVVLMSRAAQGPARFELRPDTTVIEVIELGADSLDVVEWVMSVEDSVGVKFDDELLMAAGATPVLDSTTTWVLCVDCMLDFATRCQWLLPSE